MNISSYTIHSMKILQFSTTAKATTVFKLLSDPTRYKILSLLFDAKDGLCVYEIAEAVGISHSATSHQLAKLEARGIVLSFREGQTICYEIRKGELTDNLKHAMNTFEHV